MAIPLQDTNLRQPNRIAIVGVVVSRRRQPAGPGVSMSFIIALYSPKRRVAIELGEKKK